MARRIATRFMTRAWRQRISCIQATALGLVVHQMAGFRIDQARADCQIPEWL